MTVRKWSVHLLHVDPSHRGEGDGGSKGGRDGAGPRTGRSTQQWVVSDTHLGPPESYGPEVEELEGTSPRGTRVQRAG